jgi:ubiquinone/menaquinone biosynthesis C-methylase UbiE
VEEAVFLNAGCGEHHPDGWTGVDHDPEVKPDIVADLEELPFEDGTVKRILCSHVLEHLDYWDKLPAVLAEFARVLAPSGELFVLCPDIERCVLLGEPRQLLEAVIAWPEDFRLAYTVKAPPTGHAWTPSAQFTERVLTDAGFAFTPYSDRLNEVADLGWPVTNTGFWQHAYLAVK